MTDKVRQLDRSRHTLSLGSCAPYPVMDFVRLATELYPSQSLTTELRSTEPLLQGLRDGRYNVIILPFKPTDSALIALPFGKESLYFNLPKGHPQEKAPPFLFRFGRDCHDCLFPHRVLEGSHQGNNAPFPFPAPRTER